MGSSVMQRETVAGRCEECGVGDPAVDPERLQIDVDATRQLRLARRRESREG